MNPKTLSISAGILAVLAALVYFLKSAPSYTPDDPRVGQTLATLEDIEGVDAVAIRDGEEAATLVREGSQWKVQERYGMPIDFSRLRSRIESLVDTRIQRVVTTNPQRRAKLGFDTPTVVEFRDGDSAKLALEIGRSADGGRQFVRFADEDVVYLADSSLRFDAEPSRWIDKRLLRIEPEQVRRLSIEWADGQALEAAREDADSDWTAKAGALPAGKAIDDAKADRLASRLANLAFTETADKGLEEVAAARRNSHSFELETEDGERYRYRIGRRPEVAVAKEEANAGDEDGEAGAETEEEVETPAGPAYVFIEASDPEAPINRYMEQAAFKVASYQFTSLPQSRDELLADAPAPADTAEPEEGAPAPDSAEPEETAPAETPAAE